MKIKYVRVSTIEQNPDRQVNDCKEFDKVLVDKVSGAIPLFERPMGKVLLELLTEGSITELHVQSIDRLGRNVVDTLNVIERFNKDLVPIFIQNLNMVTVEKGGVVNPTVNLMVQIYSIFAQLENEIRAERQKEGIEIAKLKNRYAGRKKGSREDTLKFLSKPKNKRALELMQKGYLNSEIAKIVGLHANTITKIKKVGMISP